MAHDRVLGLKLQVAELLATALILTSTPLTCGRRASVVIQIRVHRAQAVYQSPRPSAGARASAVLAQKVVSPSGGSLIARSTLIAGPDRQMSHWYASC